jgi:hypothetical protein
MAAQQKTLLVGTAAAAGLLLLIALVVTVAHNRKKVPVPVASKYAMVINSAPFGAEIKVNGETCGISNCRLELAPGNYQAGAQLTGFQDATVPFTVGPGASTDINLTLAPLAPRVAIFTDLSDGTVSLDDAPAAQIQDGGAQVANLSPGKHVLSVKSGDSAASIPIEIAPGVAPKLAGPIDTKNLRCFVVADYGADAHIYGGTAGSRVTLDGKQVGNLTADGLPLQGLAPGTHELALDTETSQHDRMVFESQPSATLYVSLGSSQTRRTSISTGRNTSATPPAAAWWCTCSPRSGPSPYRRTASHPRWNRPWISSGAWRPRFRSPCRRPRRSWPYTMRRRARTCWWTIFAWARPIPTESFRWPASNRATIP